MSGPPRWGVSSLDWQSHAIDVDAEHPDGVYVARCGQRLVMGASLYDGPPSGGWMCLACVRWTERGDTGEVTEPSPAHPGPGRPGGRGPRWTITRTGCYPTVSTPRVFFRRGDEDERDPA